MWPEGGEAGDKRREEEEEKRWWEEMAREGRIGGIRGREKNGLMGEV